MSQSATRITVSAKVQLYYRKDAHDWNFYNDRDPSPQMTATMTSLGERHVIQLRNRPDLEPFLEININGMRKCVVKAKSWIELTDKSKKKLALRCDENDPNFVTFSQHLVTLLNLLKVRYERTNSLGVGILRLAGPGVDAGSSDEGRYVEETGTNQRTNSDSSPRQSVASSPRPSSDPSGTATINRQLPVPPSTAAHPPRPVRARSIEPPDPDIIYEDGYLLPTNQRPNRRQDNRQEHEYLVSIPQYVDLDRQTTVTTNRPSRPASTSSGFDRADLRDPLSWSCSTCTLINPPGNSNCSACETPRISRTGNLERKESGNISNRGSAVSTCPNCDSDPSEQPQDCPKCQLSKWRCKGCTLVNAAGVFSCSACSRSREDAWQCHVCREVVSVVVFRCRRCDVWRCRLCSCQNDNWETKSKTCTACGQISNY